MTETTETAPVAPDYNFSFEVPGITGALNIDISGVPAAIRLDMLKQAVRAYISNRVNQAHQRYIRDKDYKLWEAYDNAQKADPMQTVVPKPPCERPAAPDLHATAAKGIADLLAGNVRKQGAEPKKRVTVDPLVKAVTSVVVNEVLKARREANPKYSIIDAKKEVGSDGIAFLNAKLEAAVAAGQDRATLEKYRDDRYIKPARLLLGIDTKQKKGEELPNLLG